MPLVGLIDPSHDERAEDEPGRYPRWSPVQSVLEDAAMADPSWSPWPFELLQGAVDHWQTRDYISVTMLTSPCARSAVMERKEDFILPVDDMYAALRGTLVHQTLQHAARPNSVAEVRFFTTVELPGTRTKVELSCSPDIISWDPDALGDYKVTEKPPANYPWKSHTNQVTWNQWLVRHAERWTFEDEPVSLGFNPNTWMPKHLYLVYLGPKGPDVKEVMKTIDVKTPKGTTVRRRMPYVAPDEVVEEEMFPRLKSMVEALDAYPDWPWPDDEPGIGFEGPPGWKCPGYPLCKLPACLAKRFPNGLTWVSP